MKTNNSAPLTPLAPPAGITGTTLPVPVLVSPATAFRYLESIESPTVEIAGAPDQLSPVDDAIRSITGESSHSFALSHDCWLWSMPELIRVLAEYLPASPVKDTPATYVCEDCSSTVFTGTVCPYCNPASPVESVGVPHTPLPWVAKPEHDKRHRVIPIMAATGYNRRALEDGDDQSVLVASCADHHVTRATAEANAAFIVMACNSHAAKDAKIKALEDKLKDILTEASEEKTHSLLRLAHIRNIVRAALALPCAPLGSFEGSPEGVRIPQ